MRSQRVGHDWVTKLSVAQWFLNFNMLSNYLQSHFSCVWLFATLWTIACKLLCPWDSPCKNTGLGFHFLLQQLSGALMKIQIAGPHPRPGAETKFPGDTVAVNPVTWLWGPRPLTIQNTRVIQILDMMKSFLKILNYQAECHRVSLLHAECMH